MTPSPEKSASSIGSRLRSVLTEEQLDELLTAVAEAGLLQGLEGRLRAVDPDLADTVRRLIAAEPAQPTSAVPSDHKTLEVWGELWRGWTGHVAELGDAEGDYANHEEHWHPPYFDSMALADDLEKAAEQMLPWLDRAFSLVNEPGLFLVSVREMDQGIRSFPEWMQPFEDCCVLGPQGTACVLRWTWSGFANRPSPGPQFADCLHSLQSELKRVDLDPDASVRFFGELPDGVARDILAHLRSEAYAESLADIHSLWHRVRHEYEKRFDPTAHLRTCAEHLADDWHYGEPLIADALARGDLPDAEKFVEATLSSLLGADPEEPWRPELGLLPESRYHRSDEEAGAIPKLLDQWETIAAKRGRAKRAAVCRLQRALHDHPHDWPSVLDDFAAFRRDAAAPSVADELFSQWRERAVAGCADYESRQPKPENTWIYWLIEARRDPARHQAKFLETARRWLDGCLGSAASFGKHRHSLALLTRALPGAARIKDACPTFNHHVLMPATHVEPRLLASVGEALAFLGEATTGLDPLPVWQKHLHTLVPSPGAVSGSWYREPALWMKALSEVSPASYETLLARWKTEFKRRRNLWAEMASVGCPGV
jgi:hypothetical protein